MKTLLTGLAALMSAMAVVTANAATNSDGAPGPLAPRLTALVHAAQAGTLEATNEKGAPRRAPFGPRFDAQGRVEVVVRYRADRAPNLAALCRLDARIEFAVAALHAVQADVPPARLRAVATLNGVKAVRLPRYTVTHGGVDRHRDATAAGVNADAMAIMRVGQLRQALGVDGAGVKVLVLSDGVDHWRDVAARGALPDHIWIDPHHPGHGDEGTLMLQLVHAIAPGAQLGFCGGATAGAAFLDCLHNGAATFHADVIVSDLGGPALDRFGYADPVSSAYRHFVLGHPHIAVVQSAGNSQQQFFRGRYVASSESLTLGGIRYQSAEDWGIAMGQPSDIHNTLSSFHSVSMVFALQWDDPWYNVANDYDLYLLDGEGQIVASSTNRQVGGRATPSEYIAYTPTDAQQTLQFIVACRAGTCDNKFFVIEANSLTAKFKYRTTTATIGTFAGLRRAIAVGAVNDPDPDEIAYYSQHGPYKITYPSPEQIPKPDLVAPTCGTTLKAGDRGPGLCGTSGAAPQVAGVLALLKSADVPGNRQMLYKTAVDLGPDGRDNIYGHGRVDAAAAGALMIHDEPPTVDALEAFTVTSGKSHDGTLTGALSDAAAEANLALTFKITDKPDHGTLTFDDASGAFTYAAYSGYSGKDSFEFVASDGLLRSDPQTGRVTVKRQGSDPSPGPDPDPPTSGGGGGAFGWLALLLLGVALRRVGARPS